MRAHGIVASQSALGCTQIPDERDHLAAPSHCWRHLRRALARDSRVAARMLVVHVTRAGQGGQPQERIVLEGVRSQPFEHGRGSPDVGYDDLAAQRAAWQEHMAGPLAKVRDGKGSRHRAQRFARIPHDAARNVDRYDRQRRPRRRCQRVGGLARKLACEASAEENIDDQLGPRQRGGR